MLAGLSQAAQKRRLPSMLESGLIDYWIGILFDYGSMLEQYLRCLRFERVQVIGAVMAVPSAEGAKIITAAQVAPYPSPALDVATAPSGLKDHDWTRWQAAAADALQSCPTNWGSRKWGWFLVTAMRLKMAAPISFAKRYQSCFEKGSCSPSGPSLALLS